MESSKMGVISSTFMVLLFAIDTEQLLSTIILAAIGAVVSFLISLILERLFKRQKDK
jgi:uncharacterized membrane protein